MTRTILHRTPAIATLVALAGTSALAHGQATLRELEALPGADEPFGAALAVSDDGAVVAGYARSSQTADGREASLWTTTPFPSGLGSLPTNNLWGHARSLSGDGRTIVGSTSRGNQVQAFRWTQASGLVELAPLPGSFASDARGVSLDGSVVAGRCEFRDESTHKAIVFPEATVWKNGVPQGLGFLGTGVKSEATDVSGNGEVVVGIADPTIDKDGSHVAFLWTAATGMLKIGDLAGGLKRGAATAVNHDGSVVVGWGLRTNHPIEYRVFRWTRDTGKKEELGALPGHFHAQPADVSLYGDFVVGWSSPDLSGTERRPFLWDAASGMRDLVDLLESQSVDLSDWRDASGRVWIEATGVSADGKTIVGHGRKYADNVRRGWIAKLP